MTSGTVHCQRNPEFGSHWLLCASYLTLDSVQLSLIGHAGPAPLISTLHSASAQAAYGQQLWDACRADDFYRILTEPEHNMLKQHTALLATEGVDLDFTEGAVREVARVAAQVNSTVDNIGARRCAVM